jgi:predicted metal-binding membrane protein
LAGGALESVLRRDRLVVAASLGALCLLAWLFLLHLAARMETMEGLAARMMGMRVEDGVSAVLHGAFSPRAAALADASVNFVLVALMWVTMMVGMMLPSAAPTILLFAALERRRGSGVSGRVGAFVAGYLALWSAFAVAAAAMQTLLAQAGLVSMHMAATSALLAGAVLFAAGAYELTPLKDRCLAHCRSPLDWIPRHMRPGRAGAFRMGVEHGAYCIGCCWVLMLLLFVGGVMNLVWVAVISVVVLAQKVLPGGPVLARAGGIALMLYGAIVIARPLLAA